MIIAYFTKHDKFHNKAKDILSKIESEKFIGVISALCLMEFIKILREALVESGRFGNMDDVENTIRDFIKALYHIDNIHFVEGRPPEFEPIPDIENVYYYVISHDSLRILSQHHGNIGINNARNRFHDGISQSDAFHVALAKHLGCDKLVTTDWDFKDCQNEITPLVLGDNNSMW